MKTSSKPLLQRAFLAVVVMMFMTACVPPAEASKDERVGAGVKAINYSGKEIEYIAVERPGEPDSGGGGESLNPYSTGGTVCCFGIPKKWHPKLQVVVKYRFYPEKELHKHLVSVPPYAAGEAGDIWLIVYEDKSVEAVVSDYLPTRPEWPGKIKGYPVASREYLFKRWGERLQREQAMLSKLEKEDGIKRSPEQLQDIKNAIEITKENIERLKRNKP
ncbi:DUF3304 domain-containing protein [Janthinobacterium sp. 17J80-10]|uniref:DUF3304 domain-containing protein n=1 Tax=Janthinobacterium sp. 17J80-10 TaxID=2497863 RepID=UPI0010056712|nr:DUF3304 domain-containing protein [Janthinobacterium sp. 17J80-10]QAU35319.1 DUF3304 domain-containing protein [Janthinobacterium sp. 17J80-10]